MWVSLGARLRLGPPSDGAPFPLVLVVRSRTSIVSPSWPSVKLRSDVLPDSVTIRAGPSCRVLAGRTHASIVISPERRTALNTLAAGLPERMSAEPRTSRAPSERRTFFGLSIVRFSGWPAPERSLTTLPLAKRKSYSATKPSPLRSTGKTPIGLAKPTKAKHAAIRQQMAFMRPD